MMWHGFGWLGGWGWGGGFGWIWMLVFWVVLIGLFILGVVRGRRGCCMPTTTNDALHIAKERYARGELSKAEFEQIKKDLS